MESHLTSKHLNFVDDARGDSLSGLASDMFSGIGGSIREHVDGVRQITGARVDLSYTANRNGAQTVGYIVGESGLFLAASVLAKKMPVLGRLSSGKAAAILAGSAMGFSMPLHDSQRSSTRLINGMLGGGTMGILEYGPALAGKLPGISRLSESSFSGGMARAAAANGVAGLVNTEVNSMTVSGQSASARDLFTGAAAWIFMGTASHAVGMKLASYREQKAAAKAWETDRPWQYKEVMRINAAELEPGQRLSAGNYRVGYESQGVPRFFDIYVSSRAAAAKDAPLIAFLHGLSKKGESGSVIRELEFNRMADQAGAIVAYPQAREVQKGLLSGIVQSWNDRNFGYVRHDPSYSDVVAFKDMLNIIHRHVPYADTQNIAIGGFSLGGKMAHRLAGHLENVSALSTIHSTIDPFDRQILKMAKHRHPIDVQVIHGSKDSVLPFDGGKSFFTAFLENADLSRPRQQAEFWAASNRLFARRSQKDIDNVAGHITSNPYQSAQAPNYYTRQFRSADGHLVAEVVAKDAPHRINGARAVYDLIQLATGLPLPPSKFDAREMSFQFLLASITRHTKT